MFDMYIFVHIFLFELIDLFCLPWRVGEVGSGEWEIKLALVNGILAGLIEVEA